MNVMAGLFIIYVVGVLISPSSAVHGLNHDYHAVFQKRGVESRCTLKFHGTAGSETVPCSFWNAAALIAPGDLVVVPVGYFLHLTIIETLRLLL